MLAANGNHTLSQKLKDFRAQQKVKIEASKLPPSHNLMNPERRLDWRMGVGNSDACFRYLPEKWGFRLWLGLRTVPGASTADWILDKPFDDHSALEEFTDSVQAERLNLKPSS